jgi:5-methylcytosine-specific restriction endonuclease McrA
MKRLRIYMRQVPLPVLRREKGVTELTLDHILPRSRGGDTSPVNIVTACIKCNNRKGNRTPDEARMPLLTSQTALRVKLERVMLCHYAEARAEWRKYLFMDGTMIVRLWRRCTTSKDGGPERSGPSSWSDS